MTARATALTTDAVAIDHIFTRAPCDFRAAFGRRLEILR